MSRTALFWGIVLILLGGIFALQAAGIISGSAWGYIWGVFLVFLGIWVISSRYYQPKFDENKKVTIARKGVGEAEISFDFGAASLVVGAGAGPDMILEGLSGAALELKADYLPEKAVVKVNAGPSWMPFLSPEGWAWRFRLNNEIPLMLKFDSGASSLDLDLSELKVRSVRLETGASSTKIVLPTSAGKTEVILNGGAASFDLHAPEGLAVRVRIMQGASSVHVDEKRFPMTSAGYFQSPDYDMAANTVDVLLNAGASSFEIH
jgi:hypothetical protein